MLPDWKKRVRLLRFIFISLVTMLSLFAINPVFAAAAAKSLGQVSSTVTGSIGLLARLVTAGSYMLGFGFGMGAIVQYKNHRDSPTQVTLGRPILLAFIALAFVFMPMLFLVSGNTIFGHGAQISGVTGTTRF